MIGFGARSVPTCPVLILMVVFFCSRFDMADTNPPASATSLPPPPQASANAPGQAPFNPDGASANQTSQNGQSHPSHMPPPPLAPVLIPQNTNPIPTAISSPLGGGGGGGAGAVMSPNSAGGFVRRAAPEPNKRALYVGGLDPRVTEEILRQIFETAGHVQNVKIIPDKNVSSPSASPRPSLVQRQHHAYPRLQACLG